MRPARVQIRLFGFPGDRDARHGVARNIDRAPRFIPAGHLHSSGEEPPMKTLEDLFEHMLRDMYYAEKQIVKALPKMAKATENPALKQAFEHHLEETEGQVERLEKVFKLLGKAARGEKCPAIIGLVEEGKEIMEDGEDADVIDAGLLAGAQAVEHYEISRYGTMIAWAKQLGLRDAVPLLQETLKEEKAADAKLNELAMRTVNREAA
jgi:ferritin-like metal-binding protein YciE